MYKSSNDADIDSLWIEYNKLWGLTNSLKEEVKKLKQELKELKDKPTIINNYNTYPPQPIWNPPTTAPTWPVPPPIWCGNTVAAKDGSSPQ